MRGGDRTRTDVCAWRTQRLSGREPNNLNHQTYLRQIAPAGACEVFIATCELLDGHVHHIHLRRRLYDLPSIQRARATDTNHVVKVNDFP